MRNSKIDRILDKVEAKINKTTTVSDNNINVWLAGYKTLGENSARLILGSTSPLTQDQITVAVPNLTNEEMTAYAPSFSNIEMTSRVSDTDIYYSNVFAVKPRVYFKKATNEVMAKCKMISSTSYLDTELEKVWERRDINGESYLVRVNEMNPEEILKVSLMAKTDQGFKVNVDSFVMTANAKQGDFVEFFATEMNNDYIQPFMDVAEVTNNNGDSLDIIIKDGSFNSKATIPAHAVRTVAQVTAGTTRQQVLDYLFRAYGDKYKEIILKRSGFDAKG